MASTEDAAAKFLADARVAPWLRATCVQSGVLNRQWRSTITKNCGLRRTPESEAPSLEDICVALGLSFSAGRKKGKEELTALIKGKLFTLEPVSLCLSIFCVVSWFSGLYVFGLPPFLEFLAYTSSVSHCFSICLAHTSSVSHCFLTLWPIHRLSPIVFQFSGLHVVGLPLFVEPPGLYVVGIPLFR